MQTIQPRFTMVLFAFFGLLGLALAAAGIYSVLSYQVTRRTHEIGVRLALGAQPRDVMTLVLGLGGRLVAIGLVLGIAASLLATTLLRHLLFGLRRPTRSRSCRLPPCSGQWRSWPASCPPAGRAASIP